MKKSIHIAAIVAALPLNSIAQQATSMQASHYKMEQTVVYEIRNCVPGSDIAFYSRISGGELLKTATTDGSGTLRIEADGKFRPAFALNVKDRNQRGVSGNGMVRFVNELDFSLNNIVLEERTGQAIISWKAAVKQPDEVTFKVMKSMDGINFTSAAIIPSQQTAKESSYSYQHALTDDNAFFQIVVYNKENKSSYPSRVLSLNDELASVYPTAADENITIEIKGKLQHAGYDIHNELGQRVLSGTLTQQHNNVSIGSLSPGSYIIIIHNGGNKMVHKMVRLSTAQ